MVGRTGAKYQLGIRAADLGHAARTALHGPLVDAAAEPMSWLFDRMGTIVQIGVLRGSEVMLFDKITGADGARIRSRPGSCFAANGSALGKSLLAFSPADVRTSALCTLRRPTPYSIVEPRLFDQQLVEIRRDGYSFEDEEAQVGVCCVAAPIHHDGQVVAAISLCSTQPLSPSTHGKLVCEAAARIGRRLDAVTTAS
jgi:DNA-binding IclR family transcriptional regulator